MNTSNVRRLSLLAGLTLVLAVSLTASVALAQGTNPPAGYYYIVQPGDSWLSLAWRTGIPVAELKAANPTALHPYDWLWIGDRLYIPTGPAQSKIPDRGPTPGTPAAGYWYQVKPGDTWPSVARDTGVAVLDLWHANPTQLRPNRWLYTGQRLWIPAAPPASGPVATTPTAPPPVVPTRVVMPTAALTATAASPVSTPTPAVSRATVTATLLAAPPTATRPVAPATATATKLVAQPATMATVPVATPTATPTKVVAPTALKATAVPGCPAGMADYADAIADRLNRADAGPSGLETWLKGCGAISDKQGSVTQAAIQNPASKDVVVVMHDPAPDQLMPRGLLLVYHISAKEPGYVLARKVEGSGILDLLRVGDINADGKADLVWTDTTCGAHTCFSTLSVESWDAAAYQKWIVGEPTIAYGEYTFQDVAPGGSGEEIIVHGGVIASAGAGPQRAWTETYISAKSGPYELVNLVYDDSRCLYHHLLDANDLFDEWGKAGFEPAIKAYQVVINDTKLEACGTIPDELATLADFGRFRLIVALVAGGKAAQAGSVKADIGNQALLGAADAFLNSYRSSLSVIQACRDATTYATANPASWNFLADWGYANPTFTAQDLCPLQ